jgi:hypothetical protein
MKTNFTKFSIIAILIGLFVNTQSFAQDDENNIDDVNNYKFVYKFITTKQPDNSRLLEVSFIAQHKEDRKNKVPVFDADINFYNTTDEDDILLGTVKTDKEGFARLVLPETQIYITDEENYINFQAVFKKTEAIKSYKKSLAIKDIFFDLQLEEIDSVKTAIFRAYTLDSLKNEVPAPEMDVVFSVEALLSKMPIEEATVEDGEYEFEFPTDIKGDAEGNFNVFVKLDDHDEFGNVIHKKSVNWGTFTKGNLTTENSLWSEAAPLWMYIVLTILLVGVWANYVYSIMHLFKIRKEGKELELEAEKELALENKK